MIQLGSKSNLGRWSAGRAHLGQQKRPKRAMHEDRANPFPINVLNTDSVQTTMVTEGTCDYLSGFESHSADAGAVLGAKRCPGMGDLFCLPGDHMEGCTTYSMGHSQGFSRGLIRLQLSGGAVLYVFPERSPTSSRCRVLAILATNFCTSQAALNHSLGDSNG